MKETLKQMEERHAMEFQAFRNICKHRSYEVLGRKQASGNMIYSMVGDYNTRGGEGCDDILIRCRECGTPLLCIDHHGLSIYIQPHYVLKGITLPEKKL